MTLAFGQEVAVTPLQMVTAMSAIANDGVMMMPRFTRGVADASGKVKRYEPVKVRRVVSRRTARTMRDLCRLVVTEGTGEKAHVDLMTVAGKTGTAQKPSPAGGYIPGRYVSSFAGFAPHNEPRIAVLVLLDSPRWASRYGGDSAAPAFARICRGIANATDILDGVLEAESIEPPEVVRADELTPNFMRMERAQALELARRKSANVLCDGESGRVVAQVPDPGMPVASNDVIRLTVAVEATQSTTTPDLRGLSIRAARRLAAASGLKTRIVGTGNVRSQKPSPGAVASAGTVKLYCEGAGTARGGSSR
jgi:stage V sporulation protein D (sporulation-specific penicillin-binding protein)